jgi:predicted ArsR family transcriptional regulator
LGEGIQGDGGEQLAKALLLAVSKVDLGEILRAAADHLGGSIQPGTGQTRRLVAAMERLNHLNYRARWEARPQGAQVVLGRCPYAAFIAEHPELCQMDAHLLQGFLATPVDHTAKLEVGPQGLPQCVFRLTNTQLESSSGTIS